jgi:hypothetical protein
MVTVRNSFKQKKKATVNNMPDVAVLKSLWELQSFDDYESQDKFKTCKKPLEYTIATSK